MKTIIAGSRTVECYQDVLNAIHNSGFKITEIISGGARGADALGEWYATDNELPLKIFPAKWATFGQSAGHQRNLEMALYANALIAIWDGYSKGTKDMINIARRFGLKVYVEYV